MVSRMAAGVLGDEDAAVEGSSIDISADGEDAASSRYSETSVDVVDFVGEVTYVSSIASDESTGDLSAPRREMLAIRDSYLFFHESRSATSDVIVPWRDWLVVISSPMRTRCADCEAGAEEDKEVGSIVPLGKAAC